MEPEATKASETRFWSSERADDALRAHGLRVTRPRVAVLRSLLEHGTTIGVSELTILAQRHAPGIHEATVYRTIRTLADARLASHVHAGHGPSLVRPSGDERLVVVCRECGAITPVPSDAVEQLVDRVASDTGFTLEPGHFALEGRCADCVG